MHMRGSPAGPAIVWRESWKEASRCMIQAGFDVPFQDPCWHVFPEEYPVALGYSVRTTAFLPEPVRMCIRLCFGYWVQCLQVQGLHPTIFHGGNAHSTLHLYPSRLWNR